LELGLSCRQVLRNEVVFFVFFFLSKVLGNLLLGVPSDGAFVREEGVGLGGLSISVLPRPSQPRLIKETLTAPSRWPARGRAVVMYGWADGWHASRGGIYGEPLL